MKVLDKGSKGQVLILVALLMVGLLGIAALAIDIGRAYGVKTKLNAAVDAASYEAANALAEGSGESAMRARAQRVAENYFSANYPAVFLGATPSAPEVTATRNGDGSWQVSVSATAKMPTYFAGLMGLSTLDIGATSESVRGTLDMALVLDTSGSLNDPVPGLPGGVFSTVQDRAVNFTRRFSQQDDRLALVSFSTGAYPVVSICGDYSTPRPEKQSPAAGTLGCERGFLQATLETAIKNLYAVGATASEQGLRKAIEQLNAIPNNRRSGKRVIVFFSDGAPNTFYGSFPLIAGGTQEGNLYSYVRSDEPPRPSRIFDPTLAYDKYPKIRQIASLPKNGLEGYNRKRSFYNDPEDPYLKCDANIAARNLAENVANIARGQGILIYTVGLGQVLDMPEMEETRCSTSNEKGVTVLKRLANTKDSDTYDPNQPSGVFCHAETIDALGPCFDKLASEILRITK